MVIIDYINDIIVIIDYINVYINGYIIIIIVIMNVGDI